MVVAWVLAHLFVLYVVAGEPVLGVRFYQSLQRRLTDDARARERYYLLLMAWQWAWVLVIALIMWPMPRPLLALGLRPPTAIAWALLAGAVAVILAATHLMARSPKARAIVRDNLERAAALLPVTRRERWLFAGLSVTAGFCEELLYRGFLVFYLSLVFPVLHLGAVLVVSATIFALSHAYQGRLGIIQSGIAGLSFGVLYWFSGSLLLPIVFHALADLRVLWLWDPPREPRV